MSTSITAGRSQFEEYREHAAECQEIANHWSDLVKQQYEELAGQWLVLAKQAERPSQPPSGAKLNGVR
jgi:hypothetical protein